MPDFTMTVKAGHPDFLDLPWDIGLTEWDSERLIELPKGISRHEVRFVGYDSGIYAIKELPTKPARQDYSVLRALEDADAPSVTPVGLVEARHPDPTMEQSAALITRYVDFSFSYRELLEGPRFGRRRSQMLAAFATLLVELHLTGCFWGDCSLSNVLYLFDAAAIQTLMVDAETAQMHNELSTGQRQEDLEIMKDNVAGGMADIAASLGQEVEYDDLTLGESIEERYHELWGQVTREVLISARERWRITERVKELNEIGFNVDQIDLETVDHGERLRIETVVAGRSYHAGRLRDLTGVEASEGQATQILTDLHHFTADAAPSSHGKALGAIRWRVEVFEPMLARMRTEVPDANPVQAFSDYLHFRYLASRDAGYDVDNDTAFAAWIEAGRPGYPLDDDFVIQ